uniref:Uncharacterized protein n=1 Tax=Anguilla anguilla TaxID=7936 RepID=A0A0E9TWU7_ANGAN
MLQIQSYVNVLPDPVGP